MRCHTSNKVGQMFVQFLQLCADVTLLVNTFNIIIVVETLLENLISLIARMQANKFIHEHTKRPL